MPKYLDPFCGILYPLFLRNQKQNKYYQLLSNRKLTVDPQICKGPMSNHLNKSEVARKYTFSWIKWSCKLYLEGKVQLDHIPQESNCDIVLYFSHRLMASALFRIHDPNMAGWKTGSNKIVSLKMAVWKDKTRTCRKVNWQMKTPEQTVRMKSPS